VKVEGTPASNLALAEYARIPIAFEVREILELGTSVDALAGRPLVARPLSAPYTKDYDAFVEEGPLRWAGSFDLSYWQLFAATIGGRNVGAAAVVLGSPEVEMCEARSDLAVLWDIRVPFEERRHGVGSALLRAVEEWARAKGARCLKIETQDTNVPGCRFYARHGYMLGAIRHHAYPQLPDEIQLLWYKQLLVDGAG
jgi:GNAT superfamily N-acetyltransferase